jgi:hypothetical protein
MIVTAHWSATSPTPLGDYHVEFYAPNGVNPAFNKFLGGITDPSHVDWHTLLNSFKIDKVYDFSTATDYGTWNMNHDPRDRSPNIEVGALCMGGEGTTTSSWGAYPYTFAHFWMHAGIIARICKLKGIDSGGSFPADPSLYQNGPLYNVSTHAERALQTLDSPSANLRPSFGYFIYSGDPDSRWDISVPDASQASQLSTPESAKASALTTAALLRKYTHDILQGGITDFWGLDH